MRCIISYDLSNRTPGEYQKDSTAVIAAIQNLPSGAFEYCHKLTDTTWLVESQWIDSQVGLVLGDAAGRDFHIVVAELSGRVVENKEQADQVSA